MAARLDDEVFWKSLKRLGDELGIAGQDLARLRVDIVSDCDRLCAGICSHVCLNMCWIVLACALECAWAHVGVWTVCWKVSTCELERVALCSLVFWNTLACVLDCARLHAGLCGPGSAAGRSPA